MNFAEIETVAGQHLASMGSTPIAWPNKNFDPDGTYIEFRHIPNDVDDPVISGGFEYALGIFLITVVTPANQFSTEANDLAEQIRRHFYKGLRLSLTGGSLVINRPSSLGTGFPDGAYWRQPVSVSYITE